MPQRNLMLDNDTPPQTTPTTIPSLLTSISNFFKQMYSSAKYVFSFAWLFSNKKSTFSKIVGKYQTNNLFMPRHVPQLN